MSAAADQPAPAAGAEGAAGPMGRDAAIALLTGPGGAAELTEIEVQGRRQRWLRQAPAENLRALYESTASALTFLVYEQERWSFAQAWQDAGRIGQVLRASGVGPGDRVAIAMRNYPEWVLAFCATTSIGAVAVAMNAHWSAEEMAYALQDSGARLLLADQERLDRWAEAAATEPALAALPVLGVRAARLPAGARDLQAVLAEIGADAPMPPAQIAPDDLALMLYTSGSTGHPKGVPSSHRQVLAALFSWEMDRGVADLMQGGAPPAPPHQPGTLLAVPLFHVSGSHASYLSSYRAQRRMVCMYRWDAEQAAQLIERERLTSLVAPAAVTGDLVRLAQAHPGRYDLSSLVMLGGGGAPRAPEQVRQIRSSFSQAMPNIGWGMTETNAIGTGIHGEDYLARPESSGRASLLLDLRVVDELGRALPAGQRGELQVRGSSVFSGYWNRPEANAQAFAEDGWFRTGDVAYLDAEGFVYIVDRIKDLIIRGGENIGCGQVEAALLSHPQVFEAAVYGVPDERLGEEVGATVNGAPGLQVDDLRAHLAQQLARFEQPRYLLVAEQPLARTPSGKILKRQIRTQALAQLRDSGEWDGRGA